MNFEKIKEYLNKTYTLVTGKEKDYYCDEENKIVATINGDVITLFIEDPKDELETQYQVVALPITSKSRKNELNYIKLIGEYNDTIMNEGIPSLYYNDELDRITSAIDRQKYAQRNLGSVGTIDGHILPSNEQKRISKGYKRKYN